MSSISIGHNYQQTVDLGENVSFTEQRQITDLCNTFCFTNVYTMMPSPRLLYSLYLLQCFSPV